MAISHYRHHRKSDSANISLNERMQFLLFIILAHWKAKNKKVGEVVQLFNFRPKLQETFKQTFSLQNFLRFLIKVGEFFLIFTNSLKK